MVNAALFIVVSTFVPRPSAASTDPPENDTLGLPAAAALNVILITVPLLPVYPVGLPPLKVMEPAALENVGSEVHKLKIGPFETLRTVISLGLNLSVPSAAFTEAPFVFTMTRAEKTCPAVYTPVLGEIESEAACTNADDARNSVITRSNLIVCSIVFFAIEWKIMIYFLGSTIITSSADGCIFLLRYHTINATIRVINSSPIKMPTPIIILFANDKERLPSSGTRVAMYSFPALSIALTRIVLLSD
jgi:hypothetical protein